MGIFKKGEPRLQGRGEHRDEQSRVRFWARKYGVSEQEAGELIHAFKRREGLSGSQRVTLAEFAEVLEEQTFQA